MGVMFDGEQMEDSGAPPRRLINFVSEQQLEESKKTHGPRDGTAQRDWPQKDKHDAEFNENPKHRPPEALAGDEIEFLDGLEMSLGEYDKKVADEEALELDSVPKDGMIFGSELEAYNFYNSYIGFSIRLHHKYVRKRTKKLIWRIICCSCEGEKEKHSNGTPNKTRPQKRFDCKAQMKIQLDETSGNFVVKDFVAEHIHELVQDKARMLRSHRVIRPAQKNLITGMTDSGIGSSDIYHYCAQEAGGYDKLNFLNTDVDNMVQRRRTEFLEKGDGVLLFEYFRKKREENSSFYSDVQLDSKNQIRSCFWCDAKSRIDYECFGDVVSFDTTYKTNNYDMPFAPFVGVNHHRQTIIFASALVRDETTETFVWIFKQFLLAMGGKAMKTIFTDQAFAIGNAIKQVFPNAHHRLCIWHIQQNALRNLSHIFSKFARSNDDFRNCIYEGEDEADFLENWANLLEKYDLHEDKWMKSQFEKKEKWAQVYGRQHFCVGMASTQRSESMNNYFKKYFKRKQIFVEFMMQYDKAITLRRLKEDLEDVKSSQTMLDLESQWVVERLAREFYTRKMFSVFQKNLKAIVDLGVSNPRESVDSPVVTYDVESFVTRRVRQVEFLRSANTTRCSCQIFDFTGMPCAHMLIVWRVNNVESIPSEYFLTRWSKAANPKIIVGPSGNTMEVNSNVPLSERFSELSHMAQTLVSTGSLSDGLAEVAKMWLKRGIEEVEACRKTLQDDTKEPFDPMLDVNDNVTVYAPPRKKTKGESGGRIKGFYDTMKKNGTRQKKTNTGKKVQDGLGKKEGNTQPTKRQPRKKEIKGKEDEANKGVIFEETFIENPSIQNDSVKMTSLYPLTRFADGMEGYGVTGEMLGNRENSQVPFSFQQLLADQCAITSDPCSTAKKLYF